MHSWLNAKRDERFAERCHDICDTYRLAPARAEAGIATASLDEKTGIQALEREAPTIPMIPARVERQEPEYIRHGTRVLIAAMRVACGAVLGQIGATRTEADDDPATRRGVPDLRRHRALVPLAADAFRLASSLSRHPLRQCAHPGREAAPERLVHRSRRAPRGGDQGPARGWAHGPPSPTVIQRSPKVGTPIPGAGEEPRGPTLAPRPDQLALRRLLAGAPAPRSPSLQLTQPIKRGRISSWYHQGVSS